MEEAQPTPSLYGQVDGQRGAGGKLRKPPARKSSQATPYDRPTSNQHGRGGWLLSKLVDPAYRLVASGATKIFPSFFSSAAALPPPTENLGEEAVEVTPGAEGDETLSHDAPEIHNTPELNEISRSSDVAARRDSKSEELGQDEPNSIKNDSHLSGIEMLLKGKTFSRDEISRLTEILNSRVSDASDVDARKKNELRTIVRGNIGDLHTPFSKASNDGNQKDPKKVPIPSSTPVLDIVPDKIGASPIEIARAYMGSQILEYGPGPYGAPSKGETAQQLNDEFASKALIPSPAPRLTCWPGTMAQEHGYATPNQRSRQGLHDFPRTPYSRTIYSKSRAKVQADSDPFKQFQAPIAEVKCRNDVLDISYGSVGPIRRVRMKYGSDVRPGGSIFSKSSRDAPPVIQQPVVSENNQPYLQKNLQRGEASNSKQQPAFPVGNRPGRQPVLNRSASEAVKKILDQLDRHKPTTQEKIEELKLAGAWRKPPTEGSSATLKESISISNSKSWFPLAKLIYLIQKLFPKKTSLEAIQKVKEILRREV